MQSAKYLVYCTAFLYIALYCTGGVTQPDTANEATGKYCEASDKQQLNPSLCRYLLFIIIFRKLRETNRNFFFIEKHSSAHQFAGRPRECGEFDVWKSRRWRKASDGSRRKSCEMRLLWWLRSSTLSGDDLKLSRVRWDLKPGLRCLVYELGTRSNVDWDIERRKSAWLGGAARDAAALSVINIFVELALSGGSYEVTSAAVK